MYSWGWLGCMLYMPPLIIELIGINSNFWISRFLNERVETLHVGVTSILLLRPSGWFLRAVSTTFWGAKMSHPKFFIWVSPCCKWVPWYLPRWVIEYPSRKGDRVWYRSFAWHSAYLISSYRMALTEVKDWRSKWRICSRRVSLDLDDLHGVPQCYL